MSPSSTWLKPIALDSKPQEPLTHDSRARAERLNSATPIPVSCLTFTHRVSSEHLNESVGAITCTTPNCASVDQCNQQYSIYALTDSSGNVSERYAYTAYGQPIFLNSSATVQTSSAAGNRHTYTGREWDQTIGLHHFRARWMSGVSGRFVTRDPIGYQGSPFDLYEFLDGRVLNGLDPQGKATLSEMSWCLENPCCCAVAQYFPDQVRDITRSYGWRDGDAGNAVHHCTWMCYTASSRLCTRTQAWNLGYAHEDSPLNPTSHRCMDLYNNSVGIGLSRNGKSLQSCKDDCERKAIAHELFWFRPSDSPPLPSDFPGFDVYASCGTAGPGVGIGSPTAPVTPGTGNGGSSSSGGSSGSTGSGSGGSGSSGSGSGSGPSW